MGLKSIDYVLGLTVALTWSTGFVYAKAALSQFPPILLMSMRFALAALALVWLARLPVGRFGRIFGISFVAASVQYSLTFTGLNGLDASVAAIVVQLEVPFMVLLGVLLLKEQAGVRKWFGIALAFGGVALIAGEPRIGGAWISLLMVLAGAFTWALGQVMVRAVRSVDGVTMTAWVSAFAAPQFLVLSLIFESGQIQAIGTAQWVDWGAVVYLGLVMTAFGYGLWNTLLSRQPVSAVAPFLLFMPVFSVSGAVLFLGETLTANVAIGGVVVLTGVAVILIERTSKQGSAIEEGVGERSENTLGAKQLTK